MLNAPLHRRAFLRVLGITGIGAATRPPLGGAGRVLVPSRDYGPLVPVADPRTGLDLLELPRGFRYLSFAWAGDPLVGGGVAPAGADGMGVVAEQAGVVTLLRNHEVRAAGPSPGPSALTYDPMGRAGVVRLRFDLVAERWLDAEFALAGTAGSCSGGVTPWGTWLSCEEVNQGAEHLYQRDHGWVFEVPAAGLPSLQPLTALGRFRHESAAVDPGTGEVYLTEDHRYASGLYRFRSTGTAQNPLASGTLEMLAVRGFPNADLQVVARGLEVPVEWVAVPDPTLAELQGVGPFGSFDGQVTNASGPFVQGFGNGGARFRRLEGAWFSAAERALYFADTEGGPPALDSGLPEGVLWRLDPSRAVLRAVHVSGRAESLSNPDNGTPTPGGGQILCEDSRLSSPRLIGRTPDGRLFPFARNRVVLAGQVNGLSGDYRDSEWAGPCFDPTGRWLFVNILSPGITFAITGPWNCGPLETRPIRSARWGTGSRIPSVF